MAEFEGFERSRGPSRRTAGGGARARRLVQGFADHDGLHAAGRRPYGVDAQSNRSRTHGEARLFRNAGINTRLAHLGNDPHDYFGFVNPPVVHASTVLFPDAGDDGGAQPEIHIWNARHADNRCAGARRSTRWKAAAGTIVVPSGLAAVTVPLLGLPVGRRPPADRRFGLPTDAQFRRHHAEAAGRRRRVLRSARRRRHRRLDEAANEGRVHRMPGLDHLRSAGRPGHRRSGACRRAPW